MNFDIFERPTNSCRNVLMLSARHRIGTHQLYLHSKFEHQRIHTRKENGKSARGYRFWAFVKKRYPLAHFSGVFDTLELSNAKSVFRWVSFTVITGTEAAQRSTLLSCNTYRALRKNHQRCQVKHEKIYTYRILETHWISEWQREQIVQLHTQVYLIFVHLFWK